VTSTGFSLLRSNILTKLRFENQQKNTHSSKRQKQAVFFSLLRIQIFVDLFVTSTGFAYTLPWSALLQKRNHAACAAGFPFPYKALSKLSFS